MKIIPKMQSGGGMPPFSYYTPITVPNQAAASATTTSSTTSQTQKSSSENNKGDITSKDLLEMISSKVDGLPNDMKDLFDNVDRFFQLQNLFNNGKIDTAKLTSQFLKTNYKIRVADFNKEEFDKAYAKVNNNDGLSEIAITNTGKIVVRDIKSKEIMLATPEQYMNSKNLQALTNSNLLDLRAKDPKFAFNNDILRVVENGIGIQKVTSFISDIIDKLGTSTISKSGYTYRQADKILKGVEILQEAASRGIKPDGMSLDGMYKAQLITKDQYQQAQMASQYIYNALPNNAKTLLEVKSGNTKNPKKGSVDMISYLIMSRASGETSLDLEYIQDMNPDGSKKSTSENDSTDKSVKSNPLLDMVRGIGGEDNTILLNPGTSAEQSVLGKNYPAQEMGNAKPITETSLQNMLVKSGILNIVSQNGYITFGDQVITPNKLDQIVYTGNGIKRAILPSKVVNGKTVVDLSLVDEFEAAQKELGYPIEDFTTFLKDKRAAGILRRHRLSDLIDPNTGLPNSRRFTLFLMTDAYGTSKNDIIKNSRFVNQLDPTDDLYDEINSALSTKDKPYKVGSSLFGMFGDDVYSGTVYIPISTNKLQAITAYGDSVNQGAADNVETGYQRSKKAEQAQSTSSDVLFND